ncbi:hypothetical protein ACVWZW_000803 [Bradyrhizobium sp. F1.13.4]
MTSALPQVGRCQRVIRMGYQRARMPFEYANWLEMTMEKTSNFRCRLSAT